MKKVLAVMLALVFVGAFALTAFAALSPVSVGEYKVVVGSYATGKLGPGDYTVNPDGTVTLRKAAESDYEFEGWKISGKYEVVSGDEKSDVYVIRPLSDLRIIEMYECDAAGDEDGYEKSPPTGGSMLALGALALISLPVAYVAKKRSE
ncbi:MAG: hypothetical protein ACOYJX_01600 [Acutalibacteraceae bacterium]|jgi:hypothetical protein